MTRHVVLVCGAPCSGKTTYIEQHAHLNDRIVCLDQLARQAGSPRRHQHAEHHWDAATVAYRRQVAELASYDGRAWVVATVPDADERQRLADTCRADEVLVLLPGLATCLRRASHDGRHRRTHGVIHGWHRRYQPRDGDQVVSGQGEVRAEPARLRTSRQW